MEYLRCEGSHELFRDIFGSFYWDLWRCPQKGWKKNEFDVIKKKKEVPADKWASEGDFPTFFPVKKKKKGKQRNREQQQSKKIH